MPATPADVRARLDRVTDPELDESIVDLDYVDRIAIDETSVTVRFTLPTAWCSPAFAWMMATDARDELESIDGVDRAEIYLRDHMHQAEINEGVNARQSFEASFPDADGEVASVRATLDDKARLSRQYAAVETLLDAGVSSEQICELTPAGVAIDDDPRREGARASVYLAEGAFAVTVDARPLDRYLCKAREVGIVEGEDDRLFRTPEGDPIDPESFELVHRRGRLAQTNMTGQGGVCDALNESRRRKLDRDGPTVVDAD
ncbi:metal-sulfur cluster biosynthetic enzyme [Salinigranum rubrum]|uniref:Metal-sulfur cluster biosynthetic enzyme n=1 Tax=Salinigranum rubrum TaxID=755307 RepID=A0A2I8VI49_9EURY|nr:iron-sulfur cluster assembly protein [Salinigranum rubrum]AUV81590.1 metal-sulfur cluster biosynthetic enzyme [Salinigranum rubrum]